MWQVAHCAVTVTWVCVHLVGVQPVTLWQLKQLLLPTGMWALDKPSAALPLWHELDVVDAP